MNDTPIWLQVVAFIIGIPVAMMLIYMVTRVVSTACLNSWWDSRLKYTQKFLDLFKDNPTKGPEGKNG